MKRTLQFPFMLFVGYMLSVLVTSCGNSKKIAYFTNIPKDSTSQVHYETIQTIISKNDLLQISISTLDPENTRLFNSANAAATASGLPGIGTGYLVDDKGVIKLPLLDEIKAEGLTKAQLAANIANEITIKKLAKEPIVTVRIVNYKITVLGEVNRPGVIPVPNERITLPEALGQAGDLTPFGKRNNVLLIRESGGKRVYKRFSLNGDELFDKDIYNLQNQDILYIEPNDARAASAERTNQLIPYTFSAVSLLIVIYVQFFRK